MQHRLHAIAAVAFGMASSFAAAAPAQEKPAKDQNVRQEAPRSSLKHYNVDRQKLAIQGYDPVAYFAEGGGKPKKGSPRHTATYRGVVYRFANKQNLERFRKSPAKFEPAYGGWCAYAMREGDKVEVDAEAYLIQDGRLMLFYNGFWGNTRKSWSKGDTKAQAKQADGYWKKISGETNRRGASPKPRPKSGGKEQRQTGARR